MIFLSTKAANLSCKQSSPEAERVIDRLGADVLEWWHEPLKFDSVSMLSETICQKLATTKLQCSCVADVR